MQLKVESSELEFQELVDKRKKEIKLQVDKKIDKIRFWYVIVELLVTTGGYAMIWYFASWQIAVGIWLAQWGNNMAQRRNIHKERNLWKEIWKF